jgi:hypothetical protein
MPPKGLHGPKFFADVIDSLGWPAAVRHAVFERTVRRDE